MKWSIDERTAGGGCVATYDVTADSLPEAVEIIDKIMWNSETRIKVVNISAGPLGSIEVLRLEFIGCYWHGWEP